MSMESWKALGNDIKAVRNQLLDIIVNPEYQAILDKKTIGHLQRSVEHINKFKDDAEERMYKKEKLEGKEYLKIFYGEMNKPEKTFYSFLKEINKLELDNPIGDLAKEVCKDRDFPRGRQPYEMYHDYLLNTLGRKHRGVINALEEAYTLYMREEVGLI